MTNKQLFENKIRKMVREVMSEAEGEQLDSQEVKAVLNFVNGLASGGTLRHTTNNKQLRAFEDQIAGIRMDLMDYVEQNSQYSWMGKSPNGWKLVKKK